MPHRITVVVSQAQSQNPKKRALEEAIVGALLGARGVDVTVTPHLYDLKPDHPELIGLQSLASDLIVCSWLYPRAARWTLDRCGVRGAEGVTLIPAYGEADDDDDTTPDDDKQRVANSRPLPNRSIYCLDLRTHGDAAPYLEEIRRIAAEGAVETVGLAGFAEGGERKVEGGTEGNASLPLSAPRALPLSTDAAESRVVPDPGQPPARRWYPVIDYSRCTNCMECIDFCLFGVYGLDAQESILVEQPDNCRKGCPACSRVCPENAIIFPQHKTPTIAGSPEVGGPMKIDLSKLFGAPDPGAPGADSAVDVAVRERDEQLLMAGRDTVGAAVGLARRRADGGDERPKDELDSLIDQLDALDL